MTQWRSRFFLWLAIVVISITSVLWLRAGDGQSAPAHPFFFLTAADIPTLQTNMQSTHLQYYTVLKNRVDAADMTITPVSTAGFPTDDKVRTYEQILTRVAFVYLMTGQQQYYDKALEFITAMANYPDWTNSTTSGLTQSHFLRAFAIAYDWLYPDLSTADRSLMENKMSVEASAEYDRWITNSIWYATRPWQNHSWQSLSGVGHAAYALETIEPSAPTWKQFVIDKYTEWNAVLPPDGSGHEGASYMGYGYARSFDFFHLAKTVDGVDLFSVPQFQNMPAFLAAITYPNPTITYPNPKEYFRYSDGQNPFNDAALMLLHAAREFNDPYAHTLAVRYLDTLPDWMMWPTHLLQYDPALPTSPLSDLALVQSFGDFGLVTARSDWGATADFIGFTSMFPGGISANQFQNGTTIGLSNGHEHEDANSFVYVVDGEELLADFGKVVGGPGTNYPAEYHSTITVGGAGQLWQNQSALFPQYDLAMHPPKVSETAEYVHITADAVATYEAQADLSTFRRHLVFTDDYLAVFDDIALTTAPQSIDWRFQSEKTITVNADGFTFTGTTAATTLKLLLPIIPSLSVLPTDVDDGAGGVVTPGSHALIQASGDTAYQLLGLFAEDHATVTSSSEQHGTITILHVTRNGTDDYLIFDTADDSFTFQHAAPTSLDTTPPSAITDLLTS